ncbi:MAG: TM2 domain-containing protein [Bacteroidales bacterium]|nr:TM2 domain-containing protein [Bacteroidales bacterium]
MQRINVSLGELSDTQLTLIANNSYKDPTTSLILSILVGGLGVDRFYIGDVGIGVVKLVTAGGLGIWWLVDLFVIQNRTKKVNMKEFEEDLSTTNLYLPKE